MILRAKEDNRRAFQLLDCAWAKFAPNILELFHGHTLQRYYHKQG